MTSTRELQELGFSEYEAKVYQALLKSPDITGYDASRLAGIPRAKVYEVLASLEKKGAALTSTQDGKQYYRPLPPDMLLQTHLNEMKSLVNQLAPKLKQLETRPRPEKLVTIKGKKKVFDLLIQVINRTQYRLYLSGFPKGLKELEVPLLKAKQRGAKEFIVSYGQGDYNGLNIFHHSVTPLQYLQVAAYGHWLALVSDCSEVFLAQLTDHESSSALWTGHTAIIFGVTGWITHDIFLSQIEASIPQLTDHIAAKLHELVPMWSLSPEEGPPIKASGKTPSLDEIFKLLTQRLQEKSLPEATIVFNLTGTAACVWSINVGRSGGRISAAKADGADLTITMSTDDFKQLISRQLPPLVFMDKERIKIEGDLNIAALLPSILNQE